jgi:predicted DNA-binding ribbon-helix-helix protein
MPTKNPRISIALEKPIYSLIARMAQERGLSLSMVTRDLVREALEIREDAVLVRVADERVAALAGRKALTHAEVWE